MTSSVVEYKNLVTASFSDANTYIVSGVISHWECKTMQPVFYCSCVNESSANIFHPLGSKNGYYYNCGYRFIPNHAGMDI